MCQFRSGDVARSGRRRPPKNTSPQQSELCDMIGAMGITMWRARVNPVFISSTFLDMQEERYYLRNIVFPKLAGC